MENLAVALTVVITALVLVVLLHPATRSRLVSPLLMRMVGGMLPRMGDTERAALEAGTVWWDAELFTGRPQWSQLFDFEIQALSERERAFLAGPVEELCRLVDDWQVTQAGDLSPEAWAFLKRHGFLGLIIPQQYGGLGFSAHAHSAIVARLSSHCVTAAVSVMVPNSLGPAELLHRYGTPEQKQHWLPRLARGEEIPCFALTGPENGSDAAAMEARGVVERRVVAGQEVLGLRLDWDKRYTTLGPVATVLGIAFKLSDPQRLLGGEVERGITLALVPAATPGVEIGERHDPLGVPFLNGPNRGRGVFVPVEAIIGGPAMAGQGWRMLMDCLAAGRSISLPSLASGCSQFVGRWVSAYASVRRQFNLPIGRFEGVQERLARIAGFTYLTDAARALTVGAVDAGQQPAVLSAIGKAWLTEAMRVVVNDGMDVVGGAGIARGPRNPLARAYQAVPIGITVEGANILTRSLIVFGQGAIRCHPFVHEQMEAVRTRDVPRFDRAFFGHVGFTMSACLRAPLQALLAGLPLGSGPRRSGARAVPTWVRRACRQLDRKSTSFALCTDFAMLTLGGALKRREMLSGRLADALAYQYLACSVLKRHVDEDEAVRAATAPAARWAYAHCQGRAQEALSGVIDNLPLRPAGWLLRVLCFPFGAQVRPPSDALTAELGRALLEDEGLRTALSHDVHVPSPEREGLGRLEQVRALAFAAREAERKQRAGEALTPAEQAALAAAASAQKEAIQVDAFSPADYLALRG
ncbi:MAG: acyl-CoA dehydrogenase [Planctomycetota bacterium]